MPEANGTDGRSRPAGWKSRTFALLFFLAVIALGGITTTALHIRAEANVTPDERPPLPVTTSLIAIQPSYTITQRFAGRIEASRETDLAFEQQGLLLEVMVDEGDAIEKGDTLARLDTRLLETDRTRLSAEIESIDADIELAQLTTTRRERLKNQGFETGQSYDEARLSMAAAQARRHAIEAQIERIDLLLEKSVIMAPFAGRIAARLRDDGTVVTPGMAILRLQETTAPQARIGVPPELASAMSLGSELALRIDARSSTGRLIGISPDVDPATRTVSLLVELAGETALAMGEIVRLETSREIETAGAWVPLEALQESYRGLWSLSVVEHGGNAPRIAREVVEILHIEGEQAFVRGSIVDGMEIVIEGPHRLTVGKRVEPLVITGEG
jgi:RND family efflux transporter MFP subunit